MAPLREKGRVRRFVRRRTSHHRAALVVGRQTECIHGSRYTMGLNVPLRRKRIRHLRAFPSSEGTGPVILC